MAWWWPLAAAMNDHMNADLAEVGCFALKAFGSSLRQVRTGISVPVSLLSPQEGGL